MKIGIFDPYLDTLGGGEKYILTIASCLEKNKNTIFLFWNDCSVLAEAQRRFGITLKKTTCTDNIFSPQRAFVKRLVESRKYDVIFFVSDGSIPFVLPKKLFVIFQFPIKLSPSNSFSHKIKVSRIDKIFCYSQFVKNNLDNSLTAKTMILAPPVESISVDKTKKENIILTVGRFTKAMNMKKQEDLIQTFKMLYDKGLSNWIFVVVGSSLPGDKEFVEKIKQSVKRHPIIILHNPSHAELITYYKRARIYWHAAGYGEDLTAHPERAEHFGITTVEAMSAGAVPLSFAGGGQMEIIDNGENGFLWNTKEELIEKTMQLINNEKLWKKLSVNATEKAKMFSEERFCNRLMELIK